MIKNKRMILYYFKREVLINIIMNDLSEGFTNYKNMANINKK